MAYIPTFTPPPTVTAWLTYIGHCERCNKDLRQSDYRIRSLEDLKNFGVNRDYKLYCNSCLDKFDIQSVEVGIFRGYQPMWYRTPVSDFDLSKVDDYFLQAT
jgi:hypothetical protein